MLTDFLIAIGVVVVVAFIFSPAREPLHAPSGYGFRRRVLLGAVALPADGAAGQDADAPDGAAQGDEQVNKFHAPQNRAVHKQNER